MRALDGLKYTRETEAMLNKLIGVDEKRKGYYKDLSKTQVFFESLSF